MTIERKDLHEISSLIFELRILKKRVEKMKKPCCEDLSTKAVKIAGSSYAFISACTLILVWLITGPFCGFSDTWQLVINTGTTIITFLMVFLLQRSQNKDSLALHTKLNELIRAVEAASNEVINLENKSEQIVEETHQSICEQVK